LPLCTSASARADTIRIGVLAYLGAEHSVGEWGATARAIEIGMPGSRVQRSPMDSGGYSTRLLMIIDVSVTDDITTA
jgi:hypothetical protein